MNKITKLDYIKILEYYKKPLPKSKHMLKIEAEKILSEKLCRCIKKLDPINESKSIGICTKTIFNSKGYKRGKFKCKGKSTVKFNKMKNNSTKKNKK
jgi:hypothetical protein